MDIADSGPGRVRGIAVIGRFTQPVTQRAALLTSDAREKTAVGPLRFEKLADIQALRLTCQALIDPAKNEQKLVPAMDAA
jgi:hypothetical protein